MSLTSETCRLLPQRRVFLAVHASTFSTNNQIYGVFYSASNTVSPFWNTTPHNAPSLCLATGRYATRRNRRSRSSVTRRRPMPPQTPTKSARATRRSRKRTPASRPFWYRHEQRCPVTLHVLLCTKLVSVRDSCYEYFLLSIRLPPFDQFLCASSYIKRRRRFACMVTTTQSTGKSLSKTLSFAASP